MKETCPICKKGTITQKHFRSQDIIAQEYVEHESSFCDNKKCGVLFHRKSILKRMNKEKILALLKTLTEFKS